MNNPIEIGRRIKEYFSESGMSQLDAANILNVQQAAVSISSTAALSERIQPSNGTRLSDSESTGC